MSWYRIGTVTVTSGGPSVVGSGTSWLDNAQAGDGFRGPDGRVYEILTVNSDTSITLAENYLGSNASGATYGIFATQARIVALAQQVAQLLADYSGVLTGAGAGKFSDGTVAAPGMRFEADLDLGFYRIGSNTIGAAAGGVQRMVISPNGVAFGAETAYQRLDVTGSIHVAASNVDSGGYINSMGTDEIGLAGGATYNSYSAPNYVFTAKSAAASGVRTAGGALAFWSNTGLTAGSTFNSTVRMRLDTAGRLLLNRDADSGLGLLQVAASDAGAVADFSSSFAGTTLARVRNLGAQVTGLAIQNSATGNSSTDGFRVLIDGTGNAILTNGEATSMLFETGGVARVEIGSAGDTDVYRSLRVRGDLNVFGVGTDRLLIGAQAAGGGALVRAVNNGNTAFTPLILDGSEVLFYGAGAFSAMFDSNRNFIQRAPTTPPALGTNGTMVINLTSNTNLRISARGSDGVTRVANIALA